MKRIAIALVVLLVGAASAHAGVVSIGANFGLNHYIAEEGDGFTQLGWPSPNEALFYTFSPGLRLTLGLGEESRHALYIDSGLSVYSSNNSTLTAAQFLLGYQLCFTQETTAPYLTAGAGFMALGGEGETVSNPIVGGGLGIRHTLAHGNGAFRVEAHVDRQFEGKQNGFAVTQALTSIGLKLGFDLNL